MGCVTFFLFSFLPFSLFVLFCFSFAFLDSHVRVLQMGKRKETKACFLEEGLRACLIKDTLSGLPTFKKLYDLRSRWSIFFKHDLTLFLYVLFLTGFFVRCFDDDLCYGYRDGLFSHWVQTSINLNHAYMLYELFFTYNVWYFNH